MTQGELEKIPSEIVKSMSSLELRIMEDMVRRIRVNGFSTASADWQFTRLEQLGMSEQQIKAWVQEVLNATDEEIERIYSDEAYQEYMGSGRAYKVYGRDRIPFDDNVELQQLIEAVKRQTGEEMTRITGSMGFVTKGLHGNLISIPLTEFYQRTLDNAMYDIHSGAFDYNSVLGRVINDMTNSGLRWIDYESGHHNRVPVAARRAVMTGFRQVQEKINEQVARDLGTDSYEVTVHIGARPTHQVWEGQVWTMDELHSVCGLGTVTGLHGANCYHDYNAFIPGVSVRTYTDEELKQIHEQENTPKTYNGKEYTTYEALQRQRQLETRARKYREDVHLLQKGDGSEDDIIAKKARYQGTLQEYRAFSKKMDLPMQKERIYQDGLKVDMRVRKLAETVDNNRDFAIIKSGAISGARNPYGDAAKEHAKKYYGLVRSMRTDVMKIAKVTGFSEEDIQLVKDFVFLQKHDLGNGTLEYFEPDYMMAESWRRLQSGTPEPHDITLLKHELMERKLMQSGIPQDEAHRITSKTYNYGKEAQEFYDKIEKYKTDK